jgi:geranylgeranyl reductase family protein
MRDVLVIGGGPIGSYLASRLAGIGFAVLVLEKRARLGNRVCCAGIISQECLESFALSNGLVLRQGNSARVFPPSGRPVGLWREKNQACIIDRAALDAVMADRARAAGANFALSSLVKDIQLSEDRVTAEIETGGHQQNLEARVAVISTGFDSRLAERAGLGKPGDFVIGAQAEVEIGDISEVEVYLGRETAPGFFAWLVPTSPGRGLVGLLARRKPGNYLERLLSLLRSQGKIGLAEAELGYRGISLRPPKRTYARRLLVVGDAAGQVKPTTGGGIYFGLLAAEIAVQKLKRALEQDDLSASSLAGYEKDWKKKLGKELRVGYWARKLYERLNDRQLDRIFEIAVDKGILEALLEDKDLSFDWHSKAILRVAHQKALVSVLGMMKVPFHFGK